MSNDYENRFKSISHKPGQRMFQSIVHKADTFKRAQTKLNESRFTTKNSMSPTKFDTSTQFNDSMRSRAVSQAYAKRRHLKKTSMYGVLGLTDLDDGMTHVVNASELKSLHTFGLHDNLFDSKAKREEYHAKYRRAMKKVDEIIQEGTDKLKELSPQHD